MLRNLLFILVLFLHLPAIAVEPASEEVRKTEMPDIESLRLNTTPSGLKYAIKEVGDDLFTPGTGQTVVVEYTGWLLDGRKFDSSHDHGQPIRFPLGQGKVIKGWDEGLSMMGKGARWILVIPPELGYGKRGTRGGEVPIPANATLVFDVRLVDIK